MSDHGTTTNLTLDLGDDRLCEKCNHIITEGDRCDCSKPIISGARASYLRYLAEKSGSKRLPSESQLHAGSDASGYH